MNKSILAIDTPENCYSCPLCVAKVKNDKLIYLCNIPEHESIDIVIRSIPNAETSKPTWCPLIPLPDHKDLTQYITRGDAKSLTHGMMYMYNQGYNACLDDLQKGEQNENIN